MPDHSPNGFEIMTITNNGIKRKIVRRRNNSVSEEEGYVGVREAIGISAGQIQAPSCPVRIFQHKLGWTLMGADGPALMPGSMGEAKNPVVPLHRLIPPGTSRRKSSLAS